MRFAFSSKTARTGALMPNIGRLLACAALGLSLTACDTLSSLNPFAKDEKYKPELVPDVPAANLYNEGLGLLAKSEYPDASKKFDQIDKTYPRSEWARKALIMKTYASYEGGEFSESVNDARRYLTLYPNGEDAAYAQYLLAMSYYREVPDVTRDQERTEKALEAFQELVERYPRSEYAEDGKFKLQVVRDQLAGKEMEVGRYYLQRRNYTGAINRFRDVVSKYQTTRHVEEALERLTEAYLALGVVSEAQTAAAVLGHNFPDSPWYKDAYKLLQSGGHEPREDTGSWISRTFRGFTRSVGLGG